MSGNATWSTAIVLALGVADGAWSQRPRAGDENWADQAPRLVAAFAKGDAAARGPLLRAGPKAAAALLVALEDDKHSNKQRVAILDLLGELGPRATCTVSGLVEQLGADLKDRKRIKALLNALGCIAPYAGEVKESVQQALDGSTKLIHKASAAFVRLHCRLLIDVDAEVSELVERLNADDPYTREFAAELLAARRRKAKVAIPALVEARDDTTRRPFRVNGRNWSHSSSGASSPATRKQAAIAIARIAPHDAESIPGHTYLLDHPLGRERVRAVMALGTFAAEAVHAVGALRKKLRDPEPTVVREAITALGMIGPAAKDAIADLEKMSEDPDRQISARAKAALRQVRSR